AFRRGIMWSDIPPAAAVSGLVPGCPRPCGTWVRPGGIPTKREAIGSRRRRPRAGTGCDSWFLSYSNIIHFRHSCCLFTPSGRVARLRMSPKMRNYSQDTEKEEKAERGEEGEGGAGKATGRMPGAIPCHLHFSRPECAMP